MSWLPMLAAEGVLGNISYPKVALPKHNGVRGGVADSILLARSLKPIPNLYCRELYGNELLNGMEGELVVGAWNDEEVFTESTSGVMSIQGEPDVHFYVFDMYHPTMPFLERLQELHRRVEVMNPEYISAVPYEILHSDEELEIYSNDALNLGYEGVVLRDPKAKYKNGRSTAAEGGFLRYCPWLRSEARVLAIHERLVNLNESKRNERGYLEKSSHKSNMVGAGTAGSATVEDLHTGIQFDIAIPTVKLQAEVWANLDKYLGALIRYKFKPAVKKGGKPRFPQMDGIRHKDDL